jgi:hypothetical protein
MSKLHNYDDFLNEEFFRKLIRRKKSPSKKLYDVVKEIIDFLNSHEIYNWDDFISSNKVDKYIINQMIDQSTKNMMELSEVRFKLRLELSTREQLREYLKELEQSENYEKCAEILKKLS